MSAVDPVIRRRWSVVVGGRSMATTVAIPRPEARPDRPAVVFAYPGGGYPRAYFDLRVPGAGDAYSMVAALAARGLIVVACDHLGCGDSRPGPGAAGPIGTDEILEANHDVVTACLDRLRRGRLHASLPPLEPGPIVGLGHSMGAGLVTAQQAATHDFQGLVLLGRSVGATHVPAPLPDGGDPVWRPLAEQYAEIAASAQVVAGGLRQARLTPWQRFLYHWADVPDAVASYGESILTTFPVDVARDLGGPDGRNARAARAVTVPILLGFGERDVSRDPALEVGRYPAARSADVTVLPRSGHAHNFASTRAVLWQAIVDWIADQAARRA